MAMSKEEFMEQVMKDQKKAKAEKIRKAKEKERIVNAYKYDTMNRLQRSHVLDLSRK